jgi:hypothetical protein
VRAALFALRAWLVSLWMLRWVRLIVVQWTPTVIASVWIVAQLNRALHEAAAGSASIAPALAVEGR